MTRWVGKSTPLLKAVHKSDMANDNDAAVSGGSFSTSVPGSARQMLAAALRAEVPAACGEAHVDQLDEEGYRLVVRNGHHEPREVSTAAGAGSAGQRQACRRRDRGAQAVRFGAILPAWSRKSPRVAQVLPLLYLHGLSTSDFARR